MARIAGVNIPSQKKLGIALTYVYGVGRKYSVDICKQAEVDQNIRVQDLSEVDIKKITDVISADFTVEGDLRREVSVNIKRLVDLACYRGSRHKKKLPVRGQRTRCNARTRKGKAIAIAGKKLTPTKK